MSSAPTPPRKNQCSFRAAHGAEGDGYVVAVLSRYDEQRSDLMLLDAQHIDAAPIARMRMPLRLRNAFHGNWVSAEDRNNA